MEGTYVTGSADETKSLAAEFGRKLKPGSALCLYGDLAAGKTTFIQGLGEVFGLTRLVSPTYIIVRQYPIEIGNTPFRFFYHVDLYRLKNYSEIRAFDFDEIWSDPTNLVVIEWSERLEDHLPKDRYEIRFKNAGVTAREISIARI